MFFSESAGNLLSCFKSGKMCNWGRAVENINRCQTQKNTWPVNRLAETGMKPLPWPAGKKSWPPEKAGNARVSAGKYEATGKRGKTLTVTSEMRATHEFKTLLYFSKDFQSSPSSQADMLDGDIPLDSCLADRPHRHGCYCSSDGKSPERVSDCGIWIKAMKRDTRQVIKKKKSIWNQRNKIFFLLTWTLSAALGFYSLQLRVQIPQRCRYP